MHEADDGCMCTICTAIFVDIDGPEGCIGMLYIVVFEH